MAERANLVFHNKAIDGTAMKRLISRLIDHFGMAFPNTTSSSVATAAAVKPIRERPDLITPANAMRLITFYLPAFLDFRGRIYRSGILHFHERDLARSLILPKRTALKIGSSSNCSI